MSVKKLSLRPYNGSIHLCHSLKRLRKHYEKLTGSSYPYQDDPNGGRFIKITRKVPADTVWLVFAANAAALAHEFAHVLLHTFNTIGHDPTQGDGEPFCYMLSQLLLEAGRE